MTQTKNDSTQESEIKSDVEETEVETDESKSKTEEDVSVDYEAELKRERDRREKAEKELADKAFKLRELKRKEKDDESESVDNIDEDKPLTARQLQEILFKDRQQTRKELQSEIISDKVKKLAKSDAEAQLVIEIHKNRIFPEGMPLDEQLEEAYVLANRKSILQRTEELTRALRSKDTSVKDVAGTHRDSPSIEEPKHSADTRALIGAGFKWDGKSRLYIKELSGNRKMTYDPKTKKRSVL